MASVYIEEVNHLLPSPMQMDTTFTLCKAGLMCAGTDYIACAGRSTQGQLIDSLASQTDRKTIKKKMYFIIFFIFISAFVFVFFFHFYSFSYSLSILIFLFYCKFIFFFKKGILHTQVPELHNKHLNVQRSLTFCAHDS